jgi:hypothetical protein
MSSNHMNKGTSAPQLRMVAYQKQTYISQLLQ